MFANVAWRLQRESWPGPEALAQELFAMLGTQAATEPIAYRLLRETWNSPAKLAEEIWAIVANNNIVPAAARARIVREEWTDTRMLAEELFAVFKAGG